MTGQLEMLMATLKREAAAVETVKQKSAEIEDLKRQVNDLVEKHSVLGLEKKALQLNIEQLDGQNKQLQADLAYLNGVFNEERKNQLNIQASHLALQQEVTKLKNDLSKETATNGQKQSELRKANQALAGQFDQLQSAFEEEKKVLLGSNSSLHLQLQESERQKGELNGLYRKLMEELTSSKRKNESKDEQIESLMRDMSTLMVQAKQGSESLQVTVDDLKAQLQSQKEKFSSETSTIEEACVQLQRQLEAGETSKQTILTDFKHQLEVVQNENESLRSEVLLLQADKEALVAESSASQTQAAHRLSELQADLDGVSSKLKILMGENEFLQSEVTQSRQSSETTQAKVTELESQLGSLLAVKNEMVAQLATANSQYKALQAQAQEEQQWHWQELQRLKSEEMGLSEENSRLLSELEERCAQIDTLAVDAGNMEKYFQAELQKAAELSNALKEELEKRIEELSTTKNELHGMKSVVDHSAQSNEVLTEMYKADQVSSKTNRDSQLTRIQSLEIENKNLLAEMASLQQQVLATQQQFLSAQGRMRSMEADKEDLLRETSALMKQASEAETLQRSAQDKADVLALSLEDCKKKVAAAEEECRKAVATIVELRQRELDFSSQLSKTDGLAKEEVSKLEGVIKTTKKVAAQQVMEVSNRAKAAMEEAELIKARNIELTQSEHRAVAEADDLRLQLQHSKNAQAEIQQRMARDVHLLRREAQEMQAQMKVLKEAKEKVESDGRLSSSKLESERQRLEELTSLLNTKCGIAESNAARLTTELDKANLEANRMRQKTTEQENTLLKQSERIESLTSSMSAMGLEEMKESFKLRQQLESAASDAIQFKASCQRLQRELEDARTIYARLQATSNATVTGLLEELKATESALMDERNRSGHESTSRDSELIRLRRELDSVRTNLEELSVKARRDREQRDGQIVELEAGMERLRGMLEARDARIAMLEKQRRGELQGLLDLRGAVSNVDFPGSAPRRSTSGPKSMDPTTQRWSGPYGELEMGTVPGLGSRQGHGADLALDGEYEGFRPEGELGTDPPYPAYYPEQATENSDSGSASLNKLSLTQLQSQLQQLSPPKAVMSPHPFTSSPVPRSPRVQQQEQSPPVLSGSAEESIKITQDFLKARLQGRAPKSHSAPSITENNVGSKNSTSGDDRLRYAAVALTDDDLNEAEYANRRALESAARRKKQPSKDLAKGMKDSDKRQSGVRFTETESPQQVVSRFPLIPASQNVAGGKARGGR